MRLEDLNARWKRRGGWNTDEQGKNEVIFKDVIGHRSGCGCIAKRRRWCFPSDCGELG